MTERSDELERLLSERTDEGWTAEQEAVLQRALAGDAGAERAARQYERLGALLSNWRALPAGVDLRAMAGRVSARVARDAARRPSDSAHEAFKAQTVDQTVRRLVGPVPDVDWDALKGRISAAVRREASAAAAAPKRRWRRTAARIAAIGGPFAAAAAIAIVAWSGPGGPAAPEGSKPGQAAGRPIVQVALAAPQSSGHVSIVFEQTPVDKNARRDAGPGGTAVAVGPAIGEYQEVIDEAVFY